jgi:SAM-dependent methyltransferase
MPEQRRPCPLCAATATSEAFPYKIEFDGQCFDYLRCRACRSVFVNPVPSDQTFAKMYAKSEYHDCHYSECGSPHYQSAVKLLRRFANEGASVLDYGCGFGHFLAAARAGGFVATGVEFDADAAALAQRTSGCNVFCTAEFHAQPNALLFDVLHLGDVLEHLPYPAVIQLKLHSHLRPGGLLFVEGPLEENPSPVYWAIRLFGTVKHWLRPNFVGKGKPTHLFRTGGPQQLEFFRRLDPSLRLLHWEIYETAWPYAEGGLIKRTIAWVALLVGGMKFGSTTFGNRFAGVFRFQGTL